MESVGARLRARIKELGLSEAEVARQVGVHPRRFNNYVNDVRQPDFAVFLKICRALEVTPNDLFGVSAPGHIDRDTLQNLIAMGLTEGKGFAPERLAEAISKGYEEVKLGTISLGEFPKILKFFRPCFPLS